MSPWTAPNTAHRGNREGLSQCPCRHRLNGRWSGHMFKVGLTGGIGGGKSTVARVFGVLIPVFNADETNAC